MQITRKLNLKKRSSLNINFFPITSSNNLSNYETSYQKNTKLQNNTPLTQSIPLLPLQKLSSPEKKKRFTLNPQFNSRSYNTGRKSYNFTKTQRTINTEKSKLHTSTTQDSQQKRMSFTKRSNVTINPEFQQTKQSKSRSIHQQTSIQPVSHNFTTSFRIVFNDLIEYYFLHIFLKRKIKYMPIQIWNYILKLAGIQINEDNYQQYNDKLNTQVFINGLFNMFQGQFKSSQIQQTVNKCFTKNENVLFQDFTKFMAVQNDFIDFLVERSYQKKYNSLSPIKLVNVFFKLLIEYIDLEKKLRLICSANQNQLIKFIISVSAGQVIKMSKVASFLQQNNSNQVSLGLKIIEAKLTNFMDRILGSRHTKYQFMKWLKVDEKKIKNV